VLVISSIIHPKKKSNFSSLPSFFLYEKGTHFLVKNDFFFFFFFFFFFLVLHIPEIFLAGIANKLSHFPAFSHAQLVPGEKKQINNQKSIENPQKIRFLKCFCIG
jgi:hypothetical protein